MAASGRQIRESIEEAWGSWLYHHEMGIGDIIRDTGKKAVDEWLDANGEEIIAKAAQYEMSTWFVVYREEIIAAIAEATRRQPTQEA